MKNLSDEELINQAAGFSCGCDKCLARVEPPRRELLSQLAEARKEAFPAYKREKALRCKAEFELAEARKKIKLHTG